MSGVRGRFVGGRPVVEGDWAEVDAAEFDRHEYCGAVSAWALGCTRPTRHDGDHVAGGIDNNVFARWEQTPPEPSA